MNTRSLFCIFLVACATACSMGGADDSDDEAQTSAQELTFCKPEKCGPRLGAPTYTCEDGSIGGNTGRCIRRSGKCSWELRECPAPAPAPAPRPAPTPVPANDCSAKGACGPAPGAPSQICADGSVAGPTCTTSADGTCGWQITSCPSDPSGRN